MDFNPKSGAYQRCCPLEVPGLSTFTQCTALCCSWATSQEKALHSSTHLLVVAPAPNRGCPMSPHGGRHRTATGA